MSEESKDQKYSQIEEELLEYKLTDKIQSKIISRAKFIFGVFLAGFTLLGFLGGSWVVDSISDKIETEIMANIDDQVVLFSDKLKNQLVDLMLKIERADKISLRLKDKINKIKEVYPQFQKLNEEYLKLSSETKALQTQIILTNSSLKQAITRSSHDEPAIINAGYTESEINIEGINFGDDKGQVFISFVKIASIKEEKFVESKWIQINEESIQKWSKDIIHIQYHQGFKKEILSAIDEYTTKPKDEKQLPVAKFKIINSLGEEAEYSKLSAIFKVTKIVEQMEEINRIILNITDNVN